MKVLRLREHSEMRRHWQVRLSRLMERLQYAAQALLGENPRDMAPEYRRPERHELRLLLGILAATLAIPFVIFLLARLR